MLSEEKIKIMTNLAMFEKKEGNRIFPVNRYFKVIISAANCCVPFSVIP